MINESEVRVRGSVKISSDGPEVNSLTLDDCESSGLNYIVAPQWPREFHIEPSKIDLDPESKVILKVIGHILYNYFVVTPFIGTYIQTPRLVLM